MFIQQCPRCGDFDIGDWCNKCGIPTRTIDTSHRLPPEPDYGREEYEEYIKEQLKEDKMLKVQVMGRDGHLFVMEIESVLETPRVGSPVTCGECGHDTTLAQVGVPYRDQPDNHEIDPNQKSIEE